MWLLLRRLAGPEAEPTPVLPIYTASRTRPFLPVNRIGDELLRVGAIPITSQQILANAPQRLDRQGDFIARTASQIAHSGLSSSRSNATSRRAASSGSTPPLLGQQSPPSRRDRSSWWQFLPLPRDFDHSRVDCRRSRLSAFRSRANRPRRRSSGNPSPLHPLSPVSAWPGLGPVPRPPIGIR